MRKSLDLITLRDNNIYKMKVNCDQADLSKYTEIVNGGLLASLQDMKTKDYIEKGFYDIPVVLTKAINEIAQTPKTRK